MSITSFEASEAGNNLVLEILETVSPIEAAIRYAKACDLIQRKLARKRTIHLAAGGGKGVVVLYPCGTHGYDPAAPVAVKMTARRPRGGAA